MSASFREFSETVQRLHDALRQLERAAGLLQLAPLDGREWFELLRQKLLPQLRDEAFLVVAVVGGTNIGKSVIFNHIAGCRAAATSPLASGTRHPTCLVPPGFSERHDLGGIFEDFRLAERTDPDDALRDCPEHMLFWQPSDRVPPNLLVLDTPDIDSDAPVNWQRADSIRRAADVLIAVLTQQKYNDAAVKEFFRKAAAEGKVVVVVFNQCQLPDDEDYWPLWLDTFCRETGVRPESVYLVPGDRRAAEENRLPFYERSWDQPAPAPRAPLTAAEAREPGALVSQRAEPGGTAAERAPAPSGDSGARPNESGCGEPPSRQLADDLSRLRFAEIKLRTLRGSMQSLLHAEAGVPGYLRDVEGASGRYHSAAGLLSAEKLARLDDWPAIPNALLIAELRRWWQTQREGWSARVHGVYNSVGRGLTWPFRFAAQKVRGEQTPPLEHYRQREWHAILETVEKAYERLTMMAELGHPLLGKRLERILGGTPRTELLARLESAHAEFDVERELHDRVWSEMRTFKDEKPDMHRFLSRLDKAAAVARPATSVVLFVVGFGPAGHAAAHVAADAALQQVMHVVGDLTGGTVAAAVGDVALAESGAAGMGWLEAKFRRLHAAFTGSRVAWLLDQLNTHLWGSLLDELREGALVPEGAEFRSVVRELEVLDSQLLRLE